MVVEDGLAISFEDGFGRHNGGWSFTENAIVLNDQYEASMGSGSDIKKSGQAEELTFTADGSRLTARAIKLGATLRDCRAGGKETWVYR